MGIKPKKLPSMREKKRYVFFSIHSDNPVSYSEMKNAVRNSLIKWLGDKDYSAAKIRVIKNQWSPSESRGVLRCSHRYVDDIKMSLALIHQIGDSRVIFRTLRVSGTIKSGMEKIGESQKPKKKKRA